MSEHAIIVQGLAKDFGRFRALADFDLQVPTGQVTGFLGPNGAGKSTTIRILLGLLRATGGTARVLGMDPWRQAVDVHRRIAYVPGDTNLWPGLSGGEAIDVLMGEKRSADARRRRDELIDRFDLDPTKRCRTYSKGNRQKVSLVAALARGAELLIMDEPTSGLDPLMEEIFTQEVREQREQGRTVLLSSHILGEVEKLCDRVTIIREGTDVQSGTLAELRHLTRTAVAGALTSDPAALRAIPGVHNLHVEGEKVRFDMDDGAEAQVLPALARAGITGLTMTPPSLEELFLRHYGDQR